MAKEAGDHSLQTNARRSASSSVPLRQDNGSQKKQMPIRHSRAKSQHVEKLCIREKQLASPKPSDLLMLGRTLKQAQYKHQRALDARLGEIGITLVQWDALRAIAGMPELPAHALAMATFQTDQAFSTLASRLLQKGWIERTSGPGRALHHRLTATGEAILEKGYEPALNVLAASFSSLSSAELKVLLSLLNRIVDA